MTFFLVIDLVLRIFPFFSHIFRMFTMLNVVYDHFPVHKKNTIFHSVHAFTHIRQHYFSKYWGGPMHGRSPPPQILGGTVPPSPPLGLRPWVWGSHVGLPAKTRSSTMHSASTEGLTVGGIVCSWKRGFLRRMPPISTASK